MDRTTKTMAMTTLTGIILTAEGSREMTLLPLITEEVEEEIQEAAEEEIQEAVEEAMVQVQVDPMQMHSPKEIFRMET